MTICSLYIPLQAKPGKEEEVADLLRSTLPLLRAQPDTVTWFAVQERLSRFAIVGTFNDETGRDANFNDKVAAAIMENARTGDLLVGMPEIQEVGTIGDELVNGRDANFNDKVAAAIMENARTGDLLVGMPEIQEVGTIGDELVN